MQQRYKVVRVTAFGKNPGGSQQFAQFHLLAVTREEIEQALGRCSFGHSLSTRYDNTGQRGLILKLYSTAPAMSEDAIRALLDEMNRHITSIRQAKQERASAAATAPAAPATVAMKGRKPSLVRRNPRY